jgi:hypothetical protein
VFLRPGLMAIVWAEVLAFYNIATIGVILTSGNQLCDEYYSKPDIIS